jgi:nitroreductase
MNVSEAIKQRHSVRAFLDKPVDDEVIKRILDVARYTPSGANTQPWQVAVVRGETRQALQQAMLTAFERGEKPPTDYAYYPEQWRAPYLDRRRACGLQLYQSLNITRGDKAAQQAQWAANYRAFDAPVMLLFFMDSVMQTGSFLDYGMFLQSVILAAQDLGLASCPQAALAEYPQLTKEILGYPQDSILVCGLALGYEDSQAAVNHYRTARAEVAEFTRFFD